MDKKEEEIVYCKTCGAKARKVYPDNPASFQYVCDGKDGKERHHFEHGIKP